MVVSAWSLRMMLVTDVLGTVGSIAGLLAVTFLVFVIVKYGGSRAVFWDDVRGLIAVYRPWSIEVSSARLWTSVPLGIDLTHSAKKVLEALSERYKEKRGGEIRFFVARPLGNSSTRVGMMVTRRITRFPKATQQLEKTAELVLEDALILEGALHAAYPHTPVRRAGLTDVVMVLNGGIECNAECE